MTDKTGDKSFTTDHLIIVAAVDVNVTTVLLLLLQLSANTFTAACILVYSRPIFSQQGTMHATAAHAAI